MTDRTMLLEDVLDALMIEEREPTYAALMRWSARYPEHRDALARFFATWAVQIERPEENSVDEDRIANLGVSQALNIIDKRNTRKDHIPDRGAAMSRLTDMSRSKGVSEHELARQTGLDGSMIKKLDLRRLTGVPSLCIERLAKTLRASVDLIRPLITGPPIMETGARYKAKTKPRPVTESFADAISSSSLAEPDKQFWLDVAERERRNK